MSAANVAQLTADLLIASLSLRLIGVFDSCDLVPVVGGRDDREEGVSTPLEREPSAQFKFLSILATHSILPAVFGKEGCDVLVIQQRSPVLLVRALSLCRIAAKLRHLTPDFPPVEKARIRRYSFPVSSGIKVCYDPVFVRCRHV